MANKQIKCGIIYEKIAMRVGDDERMINYEWLNRAKAHSKNIKNQFSLETI